MAAKKTIGVLGSRDLDAQAVAPDEHHQSHALAKAHDVLLPASVAQPTCEGGGSKAGYEEGDTLAGRAKPLRGVPPGSRHGTEQSRDSVEERFERARTGQMEANAVRILLDVRRHFEQLQHDGGGLRLGQSGMGQRMDPQGMMEHIGRTGQEQAHGVGQKGRGRGEITPQVVFEGFESVFAVTSGAVQVFIEHLG